MPEFSSTKLNGDCEEIANPSTAYGRRRRKPTEEAHYVRFEVLHAGASVRNRIVHVSAEELARL